MNAETLSEAGWRALGFLSRHVALIFGVTFLSHRFTRQAVNQKRIWQAGLMAVAAALNLEAIGAREHLIHSV